MHSVQSDKIRQHRKKVNYKINKHMINRLKKISKERLDNVSGSGE
jgi:hypothetical protein